MKKQLYIPPQKPKNVPLIPKEEQELLDLWAKMFADMITKPKKKVNEQSTKN